MDPHFLFTEALKHGDAMHISTPSVIRDAHSLDTTLPTFLALPPDSKDGVSDTTITDPRYIGGQWVPLDRARTQFPEKLGGRDVFDKWVVDSLSIDPAQAFTKYNTTDKVCQEAKALQWTLTRGLVDPG